MKGTWQGSGTWKTTSGGGGGLVLVVIIIVAAVLGSGVASAAVSAVVTILIIVGSVTGAALLGGIGWLVYRARQDRPGRPIGAPVVYQVPPDPRSRLEDSRNPAVEPAHNELHLHFHGMTPAEAAEAIRTAIPGQARDAITEAKGACMRQARQDPDARTWRE